jgi:DNA-binding NtrC family response regulator
MHGQNYKRLVFSRRYIILSLESLIPQLPGGGVENWAMVNPKGELMRRIIIVDDERLITELLRLLLARMIEGCEPVATLSPAEALEIVERSGASLVISDYAMPEMDGLQMIDRLREAGHHMPVLMLTGHHDSSIEQECRSRENVVLQYKPWNNTVLADTVRELLEQAALA